VQRLREALIRLRTDLLASNASWALIGGLAVSVRAEPRTTRDLDVALSVSGFRPHELRRIRRLLLLHEQLPNHAVPG
jgi:hypothetical protein